MNSTMTKAFPFRAMSSLSQVGARPVVIASRNSAAGSIAGRFCDRRPSTLCRYLSGSHNITYSGGQAMEGQGGFYASGGARASALDAIDYNAEGRKFVLAVAGDVETISQTMDEVERLESLLQKEEEENSSSVTTKTIEIKSSIKKLLTAKEFAEALNRLEVQGAPVWGLSTTERQMIVMAREKMTNS